MGKKIIIGNWKMNPTSHEEAISIAKKIQNSKLKNQKFQIVICPPFVYLESLSKLLVARRKKLGAILGAQDVFYESEGAYTGQISPVMLKNLGVKYVVLGHSEKRALGETNENVKKKINASLKNKITPIVCVGEKTRDDSGNYLSFIKTQLEEIFAGFPKTVSEKVIIAYEPIWAIGKSAEREATPAEAEEVVIFIKKVLSDIFDPKTAHKFKIIYGGSVDQKNSKDFLKERGIDGLLVGRASLDPDKFREIASSV